jgi:hypothetical protein
MAAGDELSEFPPHFRGIKSFRDGVAGGINADDY